MDFRPLKTPIAEIFSIHGVHYSENASGQLVLEKCYNCGRNKKMYVNAETGTYICHRCGEAGGSVKLIINLLNCSFREASELLFGKKRAESIKSEEEDEDLQVKITGYKRKKTYTKKIEIPAPIKLPPYMKPLRKSDTDAWNYLLKRGLNDEIIKELSLLHWESANRIVLPVTIDGEFYGTLSRDYIGDQERKVLNSQGNWRSFTVWNYDLARDSEELIVCEGSFSAIKTGIFRSVALLGKTATPGQVEIIRSMQAKKIWICLDVGTEPEQQALYQSLLVYYPGKIFRIELPHVIDNKKKTVGKGELCEKINKAFKTELKYFDDKEQYFFPYENKQSILRDCRVNPKSTTVEKISQFIAYMKNHIKSFSEQDVKDLQWLLFKSEYKDSGDYGFDEMETFIRAAKPFLGGPTSW